MTHCLVFKLFSDLCYQVQNASRSTLNSTPPVGGLDQGVGEGSPQGVVNVQYPPGGLQHGVEQTVARRPVPQGVQTAPQLLRDLHTPVHHKLVRQLCQTITSCNTCIDYNDACHVVFNLLGFT